MGSTSSYHRLQKKKKYQGATLQFLMEYHRYHKGTTLLNQIITGNKTSVHHHTLASRRASMAHCEPGEKGPKKADVWKSAGKLIVIVFWDSQKIVLTNYIPKGVNVNSVHHCKVFYKLQVDICRK